MQDTYAGVTGSIQMEVCLISESKFLAILLCYILRSMVLWNSAHVLTMASFLHFRGWDSKSQGTVVIAWRHPFNDPGEMILGQGYRGFWILGEVNKTYDQSDLRDSSVYSVLTQIKEEWDPWKLWKSVRLVCVTFSWKQQWPHIFKFPKMKIVGCPTVISFPHPQFFGFFSGQDHWEYCSNIDCIVMNDPNSY